MTSKLDTPEILASFGEKAIALTTGLSKAAEKLDKLSETASPSDLAALAQMNLMAANYLQCITDMANGNLKEISSILNVIEDIDLFIETIDGI